MVGGVRPVQLATQVRTVRLHPTDVRSAERKPNRRVRVRTSFLDLLRVQLSTNYEISKTHPHHFALQQLEELSIPAAWKQIPDDVFQSLTDLTHQHIRRCISLGLFPAR